MRFERAVSVLLPCRHALMYCVPRESRVSCELCDPLFCPHKLGARLHNARERVVRRGGRFHQRPNKRCIFVIVIPAARACIAPGLRLLHRVRCSCGRSRRRRVVAAVRVVAVAMLHAVAAAIVVAALMMHRAGVVLAAVLMVVAASVAAPARSVTALVAATRQRVRRSCGCSRRRRLWASRTRGRGCRP